MTRKYRGKLLPESDGASILDPVEVPSDASCGVCKMMPAKFPKWNAQLSTEDGDRVHFCSSGCMAAYHAAPGTFTDGRTTADIVGVWAHDFESGELVDGTLTHYVLEMDPDRVDDPMMKNPLSFTARADALAYVDQYVDLTESDIVLLSDITRDVAATYRGKFLE